MRELREDTFSGNKSEDAHDHIDRVLNIVSLFNIPGVSKDAVPLRVFPFTLTGSAKRWVDRLTPGAVNTWDLLKKWHDGTSSRNISNSSNTDGLAAIVSKLDNLGRVMKKLKENVHVIQVGCQICEGPHLDKECPLNKEVKLMKEVKYGEFGLPAPFNGSNGAKFRVAQNEEERTTEVLQCQLPPKELNSGNFILPCTIGNFNFYVMADLGASVDVMPRNIFEYLRLANLRKTNILVEMADMTKKAPLGRPFLASIHAEINVFDKEISFRINNDK
ncbi:zinc knuckle CX2CX4HX4C containing protein, partial [Tanacetum coccineum]